MTQDLTLDDLAAKSGLTLRTLRFYMQEGLLQGPDTHGKNAHYSQQHLNRLELIRRLKILRLPLQEIRQLLDNMSPDAIHQLRQYQDILHFDMQIDRSTASGTVPSPKEGSSALDYIHSLEQGRENVRAISQSAENKPPLLRSDAAAPVPDPRIDLLILKDQVPDYGGQEYWTRIILEEGLELNIRQPRGVEGQAKLAKLLRYARTLFGELENKGEQK